MGLVLTQEWSRVVGSVHNELLILDPASGGWNDAPSIAT